MNLEDYSVFVSEIGINRVYLGGNDLEGFSNMQNASTYDRKVKIGGSIKNVSTVILEFLDESEMFNFLQNCVDSKIPFADNYKSNAYRDAGELLDKGKLKGKIIGC